MWLHVGNPDFQGDNMVEVLFRPVTESPMPSAMLSHLIETAETTEQEGNTLSLEFPWSEHVLHKRCSSQTTLAIRFDTGSLVSNTQLTFCDLDFKLDFKNNRQ